MRQKVSGDATEHSDEVGETPASDSGLVAVSHLGRACAEAYRGEDECNGGFSVEDGSLVWPAVSGGALWRWRCGGAAAALANGGRRREWGGDRMGWPGGAGRRPDREMAGRPRRVHDAGVRPPRGRRWVERGGVRAWERGERKMGRAVWLGRKGGESAQ